MQFGHRGANHPVQDLTTGRVEITSQNHGFVVRPESLPAGRRGDPRLAVRRHARGPAPARPAGVLGAVPSRSLARPHDSYRSRLSADRAWSSLRRPLGKGDRRGGALRRADADAQADRHHVDPGDRRRADRDRPGLRVRLLRHAGVQGAEGRGLSGDPGQLEPGHDHDRPGAGGRDLRRADHARGGRPDHRARAARCLPADDGRPDRAQHGAHAGRGRHLRALRRRADRRHARGDRQGRGPRAVPRRDGADRARDAASVVVRSLGRGRAAALAEVGLPAIIRPSYTLGGWGGGVAYNREEFDQIVAAGLDASPIARGPGRGVGARLERVRDGGGPRPRRQLHHRLLDRERRPDGRPHRRQHHRRAGADADRQGIPADAQRLDRGAARDRGRHRRLERTVRGQSGGRPAW